MTVLIEKAEAKVSFPISLEIEEKAHPNRRPVKAVLFRAGVKSISAPFGSDKPVVIDRQALRKLDLNALVGLPLHATPNLDGHWVEGDNGKRIYFPVGTITMTALKDDIVVGAGYLWEHDYPAIVSEILSAAKENNLAVSWEISDVLLEDEGDFYRIYSFTPTGWALLRSESAAYKSLMPAIAAIANKATYIPSAQSLKVLLDDHRLMHAYYAELRRGKTISDWTIQEVVKFHAAIVDEMFLRHVKHNRGEGLARQLNQESLIHQKLQFFSDEALKLLSGVWKIDGKLAKSWLKVAAAHKKIILDAKLVPSDIPTECPIGLSVDDEIIAVAALVKSDDKLHLSIVERVSVPIPVSKFLSGLDARIKKIAIAENVLAQLPDVVTIPGYIAVTGSSLLTEKSRDLDLLMLDNGTFDRLRRSLSAVDKRIHLTITDIPAGLAVRVYDLVLIKNPRAVIEPLNEPVVLADHHTITISDDINGFVAARMRSLGDLEIYPASIFVSYDIPVKRGILTISDSEAKIETDEGEVIDVAYLIERRPESCLETVCEVWLNESGEFAVADCIWWNATKVADLPFKWRLAFAKKVADGFILPLVKWQEIIEPEQLNASKSFVLQDSQASYGVARLVVKTSNGGV